MKKRDQIQDELLVLRAQAFSDLVERWQERLWRHAYRLTGLEDAAWDVVQESWLAIVKGIRGLHDPVTFPKWAYKIISGKSADWIRIRQNQRRILNSLQSNQYTFVPPTQQNENLSAAIESLPGEQQAILSLRYMDEFSTAEIAGILDIPEGTVKSRLHSARERLRQIMEQ